MPDIKPISEKKDDAAPKQDAVKAEATTEADTAYQIEEMTPQELEAKKAADDAKQEEEHQKNIEALIKSKKYFLPIK